MKSRRLRRSLTKWGDSMMSARDRLLGWRTWLFLCATVLAAWLWLPAHGQAEDEKASPRENPTTRMAAVVRQPLPDPSEEIVALLASPHHATDHTLYLVTRRALWRSTDAAASWLLADNLPEGASRRFTAATTAAMSNDHHLLLLTTAGGELWRVDPDSIVWRPPTGAVNSAPTGRVEVAIDYVGGFYVETFHYTANAPNIRHYVLAVPTSETEAHLRQAPVIFSRLQFPPSPSDSIALRTTDSSMNWVLSYLHTAPNGHFSGALPAGEYAVWVAFIAAPLSREKAGVGDDAILWAGVTGGGASMRIPYTLVVAPGKTTTVTLSLTDADGWACPWLFVFDGARYVRVTELLRNLEGADRARREVTELGRTPVVNGAVHLRLAEEKDEVTHLDQLTVLANGVALALPNLSELERADGLVVQLRRGQVLDLELPLPPALVGRSQVELTVIVHGYYERTSASR